MTNQTKPTPMYAISHQRATSGTPYWCVHFSRKGVRHYKRFYEPKYGGSDKALAAAIAWRDEQLANSAVMTIAEFCSQKRSSNTSGVPGVHFLKSKAQPLGFWQAKLKTGGGKYKSRNFSVLQYGDDVRESKCVTSVIVKVLLCGKQSFIHQTMSGLLSHAS